MTSSTEGSDRLVGADRVLAVLLELGEYPDGITLDDLARRVGSPKPTVHRALGSLRRAPGLAALASRGVYRLGDEFLRLAFQNHARQPETARVEPLLHALCQRFGETTHYAVLDGNEVVYRAKVDPAEGAVRLTSTIGGRNPAYRTAVGEMLLAYAAETQTELRDRIGSALEPKTPHTITSFDHLWSELQLTRERGYATDQEDKRTWHQLPRSSILPHRSANPGRSHQRQRAHVPYTAERADRGDHRHPRDRPCHNIPADRLIASPCVVTVVSGGRVGRRLETTVTLPRRHPRDHGGLDPSGANGCSISVRP